MIGSRDVKGRSDGRLRISLIPARTRNTPASMNTCQATAGFSSW